MSVVPAGPVVTRGCQHPGHQHQSCHGLHRYKLLGVKKGEATSVLVACYDLICQVIRRRVEAVLRRRAARPPLIAAQPPSVLTATYHGTELKSPLA